MTEFDIDRSAPVIVRQEVTIDAPVERLWRLHTDVNKWTSWRSDVESASIPTEFAAGATFHWVTGGLAVDSTIREVDPLRRTVWGGPASGIMGIHRWTFTPHGDSVHVVTEESWSGEPVDADTAKAQSALDDSITAWLREFKLAAEKGY
jgi:uncharacterized protein YndB with AHSA1/START domain